MSRLTRAVTAFLFPLYAGLTLGVSFLATMAKFQSHAPISQLVEIGGITFHWLHSVELVLVLVLLACSVASRSAWRIGVSAALAVIWALQQWWLFPTMDANTQNVISGGAPSGDGTHIVFAALEAIKLLVLVAAGIATIIRPAEQHPATARRIESV